MIDHPIAHAAAPRSDVEPESPAASHSTDVHATNHRDRRLSLRAAAITSALTLTLAFAVALSLAGGVSSVSGATAATATATPNVTTHDHGDVAGMGEMPGMERPASEPSTIERAAAAKLVTETKTGTARFADFAEAQAAGYVQVTPFAFYGLRAAHFHNEAYNQDGKLLDPERPEDLMYLKQPDGKLTLIGVMYLAQSGQGPRVDGPLTHWHAHPDLCGSAAGVALMDPAGTCPVGTAPITEEMLHVWLVDNPDGPFAETLAAKGAAALMGNSAATGASAAAGASLINWVGLVGAVAETLQLQPVQIQQRFDAGQSLSEIATAQHVDPALLDQTITRRLTADLDRAVTDGDITPGQRDLLVRTMPSQVARMMTIHQGEPWLLNAKSAPTATATT